MGLIKSLSSVVGGASSITPRAWAGIVELDPRRTLVDQDRTLAFRSFQYFPETVSESRSVSYQSKEPIGGSHPIYQWVTPSDRKISFRAVFSSDYPLDADKVNRASQTGDVIGQALSKANNVANFIKNPVSAIVNSKGQTDPHNEQYYENIGAALSWLRSKTYPAYPASGKVIPPPKLILILKNSAISFGQTIAGYADNDSITCLMDSISIEYQSFFPNGNIRYAEVNMSFIETIQVGANWKYVNRDNMTAMWSENYKRGKDNLANPKVASTAPAINSKAGIKSAINTVSQKVGFGNIV